VTACPFVLPETPVPEVLSAAGDGETPDLEIAAEQPAAGQLWTAGEPGS
jgi:hypothetical protein